MGYGIFDLWEINRYAYGLRYLLFDLWEINRYTVMGVAERHYQRQSMGYNSGDVQ